MDTSRLITRFRNVSTNIDTIFEHKKILNEKGTVFWGWWKKDFEEVNSDYFNRGPAVINIINIAEKKLYLAHYSDSFLSSEKQPNLERVPAYYRNKTDNVSGWFLLNHIKEMDYDEKLEKIVDQKTLVILKDDETNIDTPLSTLEDEKVSKKNSILHLSDIHFGKDHAFRIDESKSSFGKKLFSDTVIDDLRTIGYEDDIEAILITGDLTTQGDWSNDTQSFILKQIHKISDTLGVEKKNILVCPGNHDIVRYDPNDNRDVNEINIELQTDQKHEREFRYFIEELTDRSRDRKDNLDYFKLVQLNNAQVIICILNSCRVAAEGQWTEYGYVGPAGQKVIKEAGKLKSDSSGRSQYSIISLHHHLLPVDAVQSLNKKGVSLTIDAVKILDTAIESGFDVAIHGHQHFARVARYEKISYDFEQTTYNPITVFAGGSSGVTKTRRSDSMSNSYSLITATKDGLKLSVREINNEGNLHRYIFKNTTLK